MKTLKILLTGIFLIAVGCDSTADNSKQLAPISTAEVARPAGLQYIKTRQGRTMAYRFKPGSRAAVWLFIHGLADDMGKLQGLADQAEADGYGILQVDLQGHGETLKEYLRTHSQLPENFDYRDNIEDIHMIILSLQIRELVIVGHSYGGGIAYGLAADLINDSAVQVRSVHMLAPYVQRIDKFLKEQYLSGGAFQGYPFFDWVTQATLASRKAANEVNRNLHIEESEDQFLDPWLEQIMANSFRKYITENVRETKPELTEQDRAEIEIKVQVAIRVTKGIRSFDLLDSSLPLLKISAPLQIIGGSKDTLVAPAQLKKFDQRLLRENVPHQLEFLEGENSGHLFPRLEPAAVYKKILNFQSHP